MKYRYFSVRKRHVSFPNEVAVDTTFEINNLSQVSIIYSRQTTTKKRGNRFNTNSQSPLLEKSMLCDLHGSQYSYCVHTVLKCRWFTRMRMSRFKLVRCKQSGKCYPTRKGFWNEYVTPPFAKLKECFNCYLYSILNYIKWIDTRLLY